MGAMMLHWVAWLMRRPLTASPETEAGAAVVEYALLLAFIVLVAFVAIIFIGGTVTNGLNSSGSSLFVPH